ncbi:MAG: hypothetical protein WB711_17715 [Terriglobales bacterium]
MRVTLVPGSKAALQVCPQLIPDGLLETVPVPVPASATAKTGRLLKVAVTAALLTNASLQTPMPLQAPDHPAKKEFAMGEAVSVNCVPSAKVALQVCPQLIPDGLLVTLPLPVPPSVTAKTGRSPKAAVTAALLTNASLQTPTPLQAPDHPVKKELAIGEAVSVNCVPLAKFALQS